VAYPIIDALAGRMISVNGELVAASSAQAGITYQPTEEKMFYEVIRVVRGIPLFWEDHLDRLIRSVKGELPVPPTLYDESRALVEANELSSANLRLVLTRSLRALHLTPSYYPDESQIQLGVPTGLLSWEREDPNVKVIRSDYKKAVAERFAQPGPFGSFFELLLADRTGNLTEGSRSNLFFLFGNEVLTAPDSRILIGITRKYVQQSIAKAGLTLTTRMLTLDDVRAMRRAGLSISAFLSGSPIDLMPIRAIEDVELDSASDPSFRRLRETYMAIVNDYIDQRQNLTTDYPHGDPYGDHAV